jgi:hypothetical protein
MADGWTVSYAWSCPPGSKKPAFTVTPKEPTGTAVDAPAVGNDPAGTGEQLMSRGGVLTIEVGARDALCQWRVVVYGTLLRSAAP